MNIRPTIEQVKNEPAGPRMNAWVAEFVMEIAPIIWNEKTEDYYCPYCKDRMRYCGNRSWCSTCHEWRYSPYLDYSEDIAAAFQVEERIHELGLVDCYCEELNALANKAWDAGVRLPQRWQLAHATPDERCRAALLAVLESEK